MVRKVCHQFCTEEERPIQGVGVHGCLRGLRVQGTEGFRGEH